MDQARWIVVASVVFFMVATLTILNKFSAPADHNSQAAVEEPVQKTPVQIKSKAKSAKTLPTTWKEPFSVKFTRPPLHVFSVENPAAFKEESKEFNGKGKILE
jgi:hypothetical protein